MRRFSIFRFSVFVAASLLSYSEAYAGAREEKNQNSQSCAGVMGVSTEIATGELTVGGSQQFFIEGLDSKGQKIKADGVRIIPRQVTEEDDQTPGLDHSDIRKPVTIARNHGDDIEIAFLSGISSQMQPHFATAQVSFAADQGSIQSTQLLFEPEKMVANRTPPVVPSDVVISHTLPSTDFIQTNIVLENVRDFFGVQFVASSDVASNWTFVIETDVSKALSHQWGRKVSYQAKFKSSPRRGYITIPFSQFTPVVDGRPDNRVPGIAAVEYGTRALALRGVGVRPEIENSPVQSVESTGSRRRLRIHKAELGFGFFMSTNFEKAKELLSQAADLYEGKGFQALVEKVDPRSHFRTNRLPGHDTFRERAANIRTVIKMMDRMAARLNNFPLLDPFKNLQTAQEKEAFLNHLLDEAYGSVAVKDRLPVSNRPFIVGRTLQGEKIIVTKIWDMVSQYSQIPLESGDFAALHSVYGHVFQMIAILEGSSREERQALRYLLDPADSFLFFWSLIFDSREGGANDPAVWGRQYETP